MGDVVKFTKGAAIASALVGNFSSFENRERLSKTALKAFLSLCDKWAISDSAALDLSGLDVDEWEMAKSADYAAVLNQDQLTRVSALVGVYKGLNLLFADNYANEWPMTSNNGPLFGGQTPIDLMVAGGIPMMLKVRSHIDALRGGI